MITAVQPLANTNGNTGKIAPIVNSTNEVIAAVHGEPPSSSGSMVRGDEFVMVTGYPAPADIAASIYTQALIPNLVARVTQANESFDDAITWATNELEGFLRG